MSERLKGFQGDDGTRWIKAKVEGDIVMQKREVNPASGIITTREKNLKTLRSWRQDYDPKKDEVRIITEQNGETGIKRVRIKDIQSGVQREISYDDVMGLEINYQIPGAEIDRINAAYSHGRLNSGSISIKPGFNEDDEVLSLPKEKRLEYLLGQPPRGNLEALISFFNLKGAAAVSPFAAIEKYFGTEGIEAIGKEMPHELFRRKYPDYDNKDLNRIQGEMSDIIDRIFDAVAGKLFISSTDYKEFLEVTKQMGLLTLLLETELPVDFLTLPENERKDLYLTAFNLTLAKCLLMNFNEIESAAYHSIDLSFPEENDDSIDISIYKEDENENTPSEARRFGAPYTFEGYGYIFKNINGIIHIQIKKRNRPALEVQFPAVLRNFPQIKDWLEDEGSENWTKVPSAIAAGINFQ